jgi:hypothetical protein
LEVEKNIWEPSEGHASVLPVSPGPRMGTPVHLSRSLSLARRFQTAYIR